MDFLALDLSLNNLIIVIGTEKKLVFNKTIKLSKDRAGILFKYLNNIKYNKKIKFTNFSIFFSTIGPGNFNGIRVSLSTIKAFSLANDKIKLSGIYTLDALCRSIPNLKTNVCTVLKASPGYLYIQWFNNKYIPITKAKAINMEKKITIPISIDNFMLIGNGSNIFADKLNFKGIIYKDDFITSQGLYNSARDIIFNKKYIETSPLYLRKTNITAPSLWKKSPVVK